MKLSCSLKCGDFLKDPSLEGGETESQIASEPVSGAVAVLLASRLCITSPAGSMTQMLDLPEALRASPASRQLYFPSPVLVLAVDGTHGHIHGLPLQPSGKAFTLACAKLAPSGCSDDRAFQLFFLPSPGGDRLTLLVLFHSAEVTAVSINLSTGAVEGGGNSNDNSGSRNAQVSHKRKAPPTPGAPVVEAAALFWGPGGKAGLAVTTTSTAGSVVGVYHASMSSDAGWRGVHETAVARPARGQGDPTALPPPSSSSKSGTPREGVIGGLLASFLGTGLGQKQPASRDILQVEPVYGHADDAPVLVVLHNCGALSLVCWAGNAPSIALSAFRPPHPQPLRGRAPGLAPDAGTGIITAVASVLPGVLAATWADGSLSFLHLLVDEDGFSLSPVLCTARPPVVGANRLAASHPSPSRCYPRLHILTSPSPYTALIITAAVLTGRDAVRLCLQRDSQSLCSGEYEPELVDCAATRGLSAALSAAARHGEPSSVALEMHWHEQSKRLAKAAGSAEETVRYLLSLLRVLSEDFVASLTGLDANDVGAFADADGVMDSTIARVGGNSSSIAAHMAEAGGLYLHPSASLVLGVARERFRRLESGGRREEEVKGLQRVCRRLVLIDALISTLGYSDGLVDVLGSLSASSGSTAFAAGSRPAPVSSIRWLPLLTACPYAVAAALARRGVVTGAGGWLDCAIDEARSQVSGGHLGQTLHVLSCLPCSLPLDRYRFLLPLPRDGAEDDLDFLADWYARRALTLERLGFPFRALALLQHYLSAQTPSSSSSSRATHAQCIASELEAHLGHLCAALRAGHLPPLTGLKEWLCLGDMGKFSVCYEHLCSELRAADGRRGYGGGSSNDGGGSSDLAAALESGCTDEVEGLESVPGFAHR